MIIYITQATSLNTSFLSICLREGRCDCSRGVLIGCLHLVLVRVRLLGRLPSLGGQEVLLPDCVPGPRLVDKVQLVLETQIFVGWPGLVWHHLSLDLLARSWR